MDDSFSVTAQKTGALDIAHCNSVTTRFGLKITEQDAKLLIEVKNKTLKRLGRVEFEGGVIEKLIVTFCDSPYLERDGFTEAIEEFIEIFYEFKNDSMDEADDDETIALMKRYFENECAGSIDWLRDDMGKAARRMRYGLNEDEEEFEDEDMYDE